MNCDYCGSEIQKSEVTMTDMGDMVCTPCLVGKPIEVVKPKVGMSVSMSVGSDTYHEIIVRITRNGKTIETLPAGKVLGGMSYENWAITPESIRLTHINNLLAQVLEARLEERNATQLQSVYTMRSNGQFAQKGINSGWITLNSTREYLDPSF